MARLPDMIRAAALALAGGWLCACQTDSPSVSGSRDTVVVYSSGPGKWGAELQLVEELRIGQVQGEEVYSFGRVTDLTVGLDGSIFTADLNPLSLRMYDARGRFIRAIGRTGEGPGEYRQLTALAVLPDGSIALRDNGLGRITVFSAAGEFRNILKLPTAYSAADVFRVDDRGNFLIKARATELRPDEAGIDPVLTWIRVSPTGEILDSLEVPHIAAPDVQTYGGPERARLEPLMAAINTAGSFVTGNGRDYVFDVQRPGSPILRVQREHVRAQFTRGEKDEWDAAAAYYAKQRAGQSSTVVNGTRVFAGGVTVTYVVPDEKPAYRSLNTDEDDRIWIERYVDARQLPEPTRVAGDTRPSRTWREPRTFDVFEADGTFLGSLVLPPNTWWEVRRGKTLWGITRGEYDEEYIVRYRIELVNR